MCTRALVFVIVFAATSGASAQSEICLEGTTLEACPPDAVARERRNVVPTATRRPEDRERRGEDAPPETDLGVLGVSARSTASDRLLEREIVLLQRLFGNLRVAAAQRPTVLTRLAETAAEAARRVDARTNERLEAIHRARRGRQRAESSRLRGAQRRDAALLARYRRISVEAWARLLRDHRGHRDEDRALHAFALLLSETGDAPRAATVWRELVRRHPGSPLVPFAWLGLGEAALGAGDGPTAMGLFDRALTFGPADNPLYVFALHRKGWAARLADEHEIALGAFASVLSTARAEPRQTLAGPLAAQAMRDMIVPYAAVGSPNRALAFFRRVATDDAQAMRMLASLALLFHDEGRWAESLTLHHQLISERPDGGEVCVYQERVLRAVIATRPKVDQVREVRRLTDLAAHRDDRACRALAAASAAELAVAWHREAVGVSEAPGTRSRATMRAAAELYGLLENIEDLDDLPMPRFDSRDRPTRRAMRYYQAELLFALERWQACGAAFSDVVRLDATGRFGPEAARGAVHCFDRVLASRPPPEDVPEARPLSSVERDMVRAFRRYRCAIPDAPDLATILYREARVFLDAGHLEEAAARFSEVARRFPDAEVGHFAANLHLDVLEEIGQRDPARRDACVSTIASSLRPYHRAYCGTEDAVVEHEGLCALLPPLGCSVVRHRAEQLGRDGDHRRSVELYHGLAGRTPACDRRDEVLLNLAIHAQAANLVGRAIAALEALVDEHPDSEHVADAHRRIGEAYHAIAIYERAADHYEAFVRRSPGSADAADALANAVFFRLGLGQRDRALSAARFFERRLSRAHPEQAADVAFSVGTVFEDQSDHRAVVSHYRRWIGRHAGAASPARVVEAHVAIGRAQRHAGDAQSAGLSFSSALEAWEALGPAVEALPARERTRVLREARAAAAEAAFGEADVLYERFRDTPLPRYRRGAVEAWVERAFTPWLTEQLTLLARAEAAFERVGRFEDPRWTIASAARVGEMYARFADAFGDAPVPPAIARDPDAYAVYVDELERQRLRFAAPAVQRFAVCLGVATRLRFFDERSQRCELELARLDPHRYPLAAELRRGVRATSVPALPEPVR